MPTWGESMSKAESNENQKENKEYSNSKSWTKSWIGYKFPENHLSFETIFGPLWMPKCGVLKKIWKWAKIFFNLLCQSWQFIDIIIYFRIICEVIGRIEKRNHTKKRNDLCIHLLMSKNYHKQIWNLEIWLLFLDFVSRRNRLENVNIHWLEKKYRHNFLKLW